MPRPPLPIGTWGEISTRVTKTNKNGKPIEHLAHAKFRDHDGKLVRSDRWFVSAACSARMMCMTVEQSI